MGTIGEAFALGMGTGIVIGLIILTVTVYFMLTDKKIRF